MTLPPAFGRFGIEGGLSCFGSGSAVPSLCALVAATRIVRFERLLARHAAGVRAVATTRAGNRRQARRPTGARRCAMSSASRFPCSGALAAGRQSFCRCGCSASSMTNRPAMILAHELAHLRRRDHWVRSRRADRFDDLLVESAGVGDSAADSPGRGPLLRRVGPLGIPRLHEALRRGRAQDGGVAERVAVGARLLPASPFLRSLSLKARIEMILESRFAPCVSTRSMFAIALLALLRLALVRSDHRRPRPGQAQLMKHRRRRPASRMRQRLPNFRTFSNSSRAQPASGWRQDHDSRSPTARPTR